MKLSYVNSYFPRYDARCDGYVRVAEQTLTSLKLAHVMSGFDDGLLAELRTAKCDAVGAGYTEWQTTVSGARQISVGWDASFESRVGGLLGQVRAQARRSEHLTRVG